MSEVHRLHRLMAEDPAWRLLRSDTVYFAAALLPQHLSAQEPRLRTEVLFELLDADLAAMREEGFEVTGDAAGYCNLWRGNGILARRVIPDSREETYELTPAALSAFAFIAGLEDTRVSINQSRLATIQQRIRQVVRDTDPDVMNRMRALQRERARIDQQIQRVGRGEMPPVDDRHAADDVRDVLSLVEALPRDFTRVRTQLEEINRNLREKLIDSSGQRGTVLADVFRGVDHLAESDAGRSFEGFYGLIMDPELGAEFEDNIEVLAHRPFARTLPASDLRFLEDLMGLMQDRSAEVESVMTNLTRSLRRFVQTDEFRTDRVLGHEIRAANASALELFRHVQPYQDTGFDFELSAIDISSLGAWQLYDPGDARIDSQIVDAPEPEAVDWAELLRRSRETDIDYEELRRSVADAFAAADPAGRAAGISVGQVLAHRPATQGVASIIGLLSLAGDPGPDTGEETVSWRTIAGTRRSARIPLTRFTRPPAGSRGFQPRKDI
ncbi:DUF3375 domain-containing protein [Brevibacterium sp. 50QC2O2]|uniref:DUF3375 domain-containing protein n=1 Tax=Brevibacterium TaxID=1696 RepID=UPI00211CB44C|nr:MULTISPECIES: DUF3375 domain-containing protein [unclassified Brevibacterium]MCQ9385292.1 DUF3375 domain-containing protein [Brevibacterium sp. 68QC2CO]MCQ9388798.1 DUF3375 domain-containing protein [Brevibacterium sp. 50QC2O2]